MPRYIAFLRGVSPQNLRMPDLARCLEEDGALQVKTLLSSGNVAFNHTSMPASRLEKRIEAALEKRVQRSFYTIVRSQEELNGLIHEDPFAAFPIPRGAKRIVTFARGLLETPSGLPVRKGDAQLLVVKGREAFSCYVPGPEGPVFMTLIEKLLGKNLTTRTWETVKKCAQA